MATLKFNNLQKIYPNNVQAVFDFSLEIKDKEFIVFVGPSGCGKSTTLRMVAGLEEISDGELFIDNKLVNFVDPKDRDIAMVFQSYALYPHMTVYDNMAFGLKIRKGDFKIFENTPELKLAQANVAKARKELFKINKKVAKHPGDDKLKALQIEKLTAAHKAIDELHEASHPIKGISELLFNRWTKKAALCEKEILKLTRLIDSLSNRPEESVDVHYLSSLRIELASKEKELDEANKQVKFFQNKDNNVELIEHRHYTKDEIFEEVLHAAEILDLFVYLNRKPAALSGGQRQRVALGRAIVRKPKVFLMDEPLSNLDAKLRTQTRAEIAQIHRTVGATTIYVTHDQVEAMTLADRIVIMKDGYIQQVSTPKEAYEKPANMFVGGFIGSPAMNFLRGTFTGKDFEIKNGKEKINISLTKKIIDSLKDYKGKELYVGIRPEYMSLKSEFKDKCDLATVSLKFTEYELIGHEFILYFDVNGQRLSAKVKSEDNLDKSKKYDFVIQLDKIHFFDKDTTKAII